MMRRIWIYLWLALLISQALMLWLNGLNRAPIAFELDPMRAEMLELASLNHEQWMALAGSEADTAIKLENSDGPGALVRREELLLALRDIEGRLMAHGTEVQVASDAQAWIASGARSAANRETGGRFNAYLVGISLWLEPFLQPDDGIELRRAALQPGPAVFPSLYFECSGDPRQVGRQLLASGSRCVWELNDIELYRTNEYTDWWIQGSCVFSQPAEP